jgi:hypothetical protein
MESKFGSNLDDDSIDAMLARRGYDPDRLLTRKETEAMFAACGVRFKASTMGRFAATRDDGPPYQILFGRALMRPRESLRWALSRASAVRRSPPPEVRRPRVKPDKQPNKPSARKSRSDQSSEPTHAW